MSLDSSYRRAVDVLRECDTRDSWVSYWPRNCPASFLPSSTGKSKSLASLGPRRGEMDVAFCCEEGQGCAHWTQRHVPQARTWAPSPAECQSSAWPTRGEFTAPTAGRSRRLLPFLSHFLTLLTMFPVITSHISRLSSLPFLRVCFWENSNLDRHQGLREVKAWI